MVSTSPGFIAARRHQGLPGALLGGAVVVETVFSWPGLGLLAYESLFARDLNLLLGIFFISACLVVLVNLVVDLLYASLDPRIDLK